MKLTPLQKRAERKSRNKTMVDMNLVSLIDVFTILIFFLLSSASGVELLASPKSVKLPISNADKTPKETIVVVVSDQDIVVDGRKVATVAEAMSAKDDLVVPLKEELDILAQRQAIRAENEKQGRTVTIMGDKDIPYQLLRKVMYTSARANFADVAFAVRRKDGT
jgi:biopolymer transport protein ExbD